MQALPSCLSIAGCILTPPEGTDEGAIEKVKTFWSTVGSNVELMDAHHHDNVLAITSHLAAPDCL